MNSVEISINRPLDSKPIIPKRSFAFDKDVSTIISSLGTNHAYIDQWQTKRKSLISIHMDILNTMYQSVSKELDISIQKTDFLIEFLRLKSLQIHKFALVSFKPISPSRNSVENSVDFPNKSLMDPFTEIWGSMDRINNENQKKTQEFCNFIDQNLLKSMLLEEQRSFTSTVSKFKSKVLSAKKRLEKLEQETDWKFESYCRVYDEMVKELTNKRRIVTKKSLYLYQHDYLSSAIDHEILHKDFANIMIAFFREIWLKEKLKKEKTQEVLRNFYEEFTKLYKSDRDLKILDGLIKDLDPKTIVKKQFDLNNLLNEQQIKIFNKEEAKLDDLEVYLSSFKLEEINESELILGKFTCMRQMNVIRNKKDTWTYGIAVFTKDSWLLIINDANDMYKEAQYLLDLSRCTFDDSKEDTLLLVIKEKNKGWCKKDFVHWIRFDSIADKENFLCLLKGG